jgi:uncharacterized protein (DUF1697 family)
VTTRVTLLGAGELRAALEANPFRQVADNPSRMLLLVLRDPTAAASLQPLLGKDWGPERIALGRSVAYLWTPDGVVKGKLWAAVDRAVGEGGTARNLATMTKLVALALGA